MNRHERIIPFFANPDSTHCFQACLRMILKYFLPDKEYSWDELDILTGKKNEKFTWRSKALIELQSIGFEIINWGLFDHSLFVKDPVGYLNKLYGEEKAKIKIENCDLEYEKQNSELLLEKVKSKITLPSISDINNILDEGYLVLCNVNSMVLNNKDGYLGHFILVNAVRNDHIIVHDPGLPPVENRKLSLDLFSKAWEYPSIEQRNILALKI